MIAQVKVRQKVIPGRGKYICFSKNIYRKTLKKVAVSGIKNSTGFITRAPTIAH